MERNGWQLQFCEFFTVLCANNRDKLGVYPKTTTVSVYDTKTQGGRHHEEKVDPATAADGKEQAQSHHHRPTGVLHGTPDRKIGDTRAGRGRSVTIRQIKKIGGASRRFSFSRPIATENVKQIFYTEIGKKRKGGSPCNLPVFFKTAI